MAGYVILGSEWTASSDEFRFNIGQPNLAQVLNEENDNRRVMVLQVDGDELEAVLWGLSQWGVPGRKLYPVSDVRKGVWVAYHSDWSGAQVFLEETEALRWALDNACTSVKFWEFGQDKPN